MVRPRSAEKGAPESGAGSSSNWRAAVGRCFDCYEVLPRYLVGVSRIGRTKSSTVARNLAGSAIGTSGWLVPNLNDVSAGNRITGGRNSAMRADRHRKRASRGRRSAYSCRGHLAAAAFSREPRAANHPHNKSAVLWGARFPGKQSSLEGVLLPLGSVSRGQSLAPALWRSLHWRCHVLSALLRTNCTDGAREDRGQTKYRLVSSWPNRAAMEKRCPMAKPPGAADSFRCCRCSSERRSRFERFAATNCADPRAQNT